MTTEPCPHCGAEKVKTDWCADFYGCGTLADLADRERSVQCYEQQIKQQAAEIARLREELKETRGEVK